MRYALFFLLFLSPIAALAAPAADTEAVTVGPWRIEASYRGSDFDRCVMSRITDDGIEVRFVRDIDGLSLAMTSSRWRLKRGETYPVKLEAASSDLEAVVSASSDSVSVLLKDERFLKSLKLAETLNVRGAGSTIQVALDRSADGLQRLEACYEKNDKATETNPFVAPPRSP